MVYLVCLTYQVASVMQEKVKKTGQVMGSKVRMEAQNNSENSIIILQGTHILQLPFIVELRQNVRHRMCPMATDPELQIINRQLQDRFRSCSRVVRKSHR